MEQATHNKEEIPTKKKATPTGKIPRKRNVADTVTNDTNPNPTKKSTPANHNLVNRTTWSPAKMYKEFHKHIVYIYNLIEDQIFICAIKRGCDNKAFFTKPIKDMFRNDPDKCLEDFHILSLEQLRDPSAEQSLNKPLPKTIKGDFNEEGFICYREDGESIEDFKTFFAMLSLHMPMSLTVDTLDATMNSITSLSLMSMWKSPSMLFFAINQQFAVARNCIGNLE